MQVFVLLCRKTLPCSKGIETGARDLSNYFWHVEKHCPVPKGLRLVTCYRITTTITCRKTLPCSKGIETLPHILVYRSQQGRKTLPCSKGIETGWRLIVHPTKPSRKTLPCSKGIETRLMNKVAITFLSKDIALFQRDWDHTSHGFHLLVFVERHCPVPKGLRRTKSLGVVRTTKSKEIALFQRDWDTPNTSARVLNPLSKDIALFQRDWDCNPTVVIR